MHQKLSWLSPPPLKSARELGSQEMQEIPGQQNNSITSLKPSAHAKSAMREQPLQTPTANHSPDGEKATTLTLLSN
jgi:hypothetical protein